MLSFRFESEFRVWNSASHRSRSHAKPSPLISSPLRRQGPMSIFVEMTHLTQSRPWYGTLPFNSAEIGPCLRRGDGCGCLPAARIDARSPPGRNTMRFDHKAVPIVLAAVLVDTIGFGIIMPVFPRLITTLGHVDLEQATRIAGYMLVMFAGMQFV